MKQPMTFDNDQGDHLLNERVKEFKRQGHDEATAHGLALKGHKGLKANIPAGHRLRSLEIRPAANGVVVRHSFERLPQAGKSASAVGSGNGLSAPDYQPDQEHVFGSQDAAIQHLQGHLSHLFG